MNEVMFFRDGLVKNLPLYLRMFLPKKSKPSAMLVTLVFSSESFKPRSLRKFSTSGLTWVSSSSFVLPVIMKSAVRYFQGAITKAHKEKEVLKKIREPLAFLVQNQVECFFNPCHA